MLYSAMFSCNLSQKESVQKPRALYGPDAQLPHSILSSPIFLNFFKILISHYISISLNQDMTFDFSISLNQNKLCHSFFYYYYRRVTHGPIHLSNTFNFINMYRSTLGS